MKITTLNKKEDDPGIRDFEKREWPLADIEHYGKAIDIKKEEFTLIAKNDKGEILGILDLILEANLAMIDGLLVSSKHRNKGVGTKLLKQAETFAKEKNCTKIYLETNEGWKAVDFYKKNNYKITGEHENHFLGQKGLIFTKFL